MTEQNETQNQPSNTSGGSGSTNIEPPEWYKTPPPWYSSGGPQQNAPQHSPVQSRADILSAVNSLPDKIVDAIREAFPSQPEPAQQQQQQQQNASEQQTVTEQQPGKKNSFAEWWFGG